jgi:hypothetical protein
MNKEFIPYNLAIQLKELDFDEECLKWYDRRTKKLYSVGLYEDIPAPLFQQALRWFREKYEFTYEIIVRDESTITEYIAWVSIFNNNKIQKVCVVNYSDSPHTYEEAELACLKKLIEIVKNK